MQKILKFFTYYLSLVEANYDFQSSFGAPIELKRVSLKSHAKKLSFIIFIKSPASSSFLNQWIVDDPQERESGTFNHALSTNRKHAGNTIISYLLGFQSSIFLFRTHLA